MNFEQHHCRGLNKAQFPDEMGAIQIAEEIFSSCYRLVSNILPLYSFNNIIIEFTIESYRLLQDNWQNSSIAAPQNFYCTREYGDISYVGSENSIKYTFGVFEYLTWI